MGLVGTTSRIRSRCDHALAKCHALTAARPTAEPFKTFQKIVSSLKLRKLGYLQDRFCTSKGDDAKRLFFLTGKLNLAGTPAQDWKLKVVTSGPVTVP